VIKSNAGVHEGYVQVIQANAGVHEVFAGKQKSPAMGFIISFRILLHSEENQ